ncbi:PREDICTED: LOW QUALITY PROTEIN: serine/threonine-protein kinase-like protein At3g51990 [Tarenaya hassleriana]|uniref:LOW QUALITY PROTEIN: serine/threonine-protein kinase-like protein At3g51990 n=1 Tax=Tarenaya hassleriana TaxID=28532 RepID=UPI0008FD2563|nr:PREDICTED: LOW QUALITY PROTEIN: serine/threonine-protein kinase-like protein At3g51990 [Tarenaya hassleriana]
MGYLSCKAETAVAVVTGATAAVGGKKPSAANSGGRQEVEPATNGFSDQKLLGKGSHGSVYKAVVRGRRVAVKKPSRGQELSQEVNNEIEILSKIHSPRLVNLLGFTDDSQDRLLVVEFMCNGTLYDVLHANSSSSSRPLNWGRRIRMALQVAKAVEVLHSQKPPIIHRDIKSANVLIDRSFNARLGDFGLALRCGVDDYRLRSTPPAGTIGYLDPNYVTPDNLSTKTDVFSFGILLLEIISGRKAIDIGHSPPSIVDWAIPLVKKGKILSIYDPRTVPPKDPVVSKQLALIAAKCVRSCREKRPSMKEIVDWLTGLCKLVPLHSWNINNPCMMVETMGRPVEYRRSQERAHHRREDDDTDGKFSRNMMRDSRKVYSDLGIRSNLMELMAETEAESRILDEDCSSHTRGKSQTRVDNNRNKGPSRLRRHQSAGESSELFTEKEFCLSV